MTCMHPTGKCTCNVYLERVLSMIKEGYVNVFIKELQSLGAKYDLARVYDDFIYMCACSLANPTKQPFSVDRENEYLKCISKYSTDEQASFSKMFSWVILALEENPEQDFLGKILNKLHLCSSSLGQVFTPYNVSELMASVVLEQSIVKENSSICDPCCGTGAMLIAARNIISKQRQASKFFIVGIEIDYSVGLSAFVQLSLLGAKGYVQIGDSMLNTYDEKDRWYFPGNLLY